MPSASHLKCNIFQPMAWTYINDGICDKINLHETCCWDGTDCLSRYNTICQSCSEEKKLHSIKVRLGNDATAAGPDELKCKQK
jgi:hypothetical protein